MEQFFTPDDVREKVFMGFDWRFALTDLAELPSADVQWRSVQLPHDWSTDYPLTEDAPSCGSGGYARTGIGYYEKRFAAFAGEGEQVTLFFEGVFMNCDVWVNGVHVGGHVYGYTSFEIDITSALCEGENILLVRVDNSHQPGSRWYTGSGITRNVYIQKRQNLHVKTWGVHITTPDICTDKASVSIRTHINGAFGVDGVRLVTDILDPNGAVCASGEADVTSKNDVSVHQQFVVDEPRLWDIGQGNLYIAVSRLFQGNTLVDEVRTRFGIRQIEFSVDQGFLLNGRKEILRGVCLHHDGGCVGAAVPVEIWSRRLHQLADMGVNALRFSHNPPDIALLDLADEMGFVVMDEAFDEWQLMKGKEFGSNTHESRGYSEWYESCYRDDMVSMLLRDRNHPSIIMWSIGNEVREQVSEDGWRVARELAAICHSYDPERPVTQGCDQVKAEPVAAYEKFLSELDIVGVNYTDRWRERTETFYDEEKIEHPDWLMLGTEDTCVNGKRGDYRLNTPQSVWGRTPYYAHMLKAEKLWKYTRTHPFVIGNFMWTGIDYLGECFWPDRGSSAGVIDTCGFEKDGFYFYKSIWRKDEPVLHVCPHLNLDLDQGAIYPLIVYTNCHAAELFIDGKSYGIKAYEFPSQGMTKHWAHFERPQSPITTNDLHLGWDIPYNSDACIEVVGYGVDGQETARASVKRAGAPHQLKVTLDRQILPADGRSVAQFEVALLDEAGQVVPDQDKKISVSVDGGELLGLDSGNYADRELARSGKRETYRGLAYGIVRARRAPGAITVHVCADGLEPVELHITAQ